MKQSTKTIWSIIILAAAILAIVLMFRAGMFGARPTNDMTGVVPSEMTSPATSFAWRYEDGAEDLDGLPKTMVFLDVTYANGKVVSGKVDEVQGSCNAVDPSKDDADITTGSTKIQCYAAGFGEWYKIVKVDTSYEIRRKYFEEASPEMMPTDFPYETVAAVPLFQ